MSAYNVVRMRVKPEFLDEFLTLLPRPAARHARHEGDGHGADRRAGVLLIGEWSDMEAIVAARPAMLASLDEHRHKLEDLGSGLGVTDPISGKAVIERWSGERDAPASGPLASE